MKSLKKSIGSLVIICLIAACSSLPVTASNAAPLTVQVPKGMPTIDYNSAVYEVPVKAGVSYTDVVDSLKSISEGMNFVNPANFPIGEHMQNRGQHPQGVLEVRAFCNLGLGAEIMLDHPEFVVFAPCRIALYEKQTPEKKLQLFLALARPTFDLQSIRQPTERAKAAAVKLEEALLRLIDQASKGDF